MPAIEEFLRGRSPLDDKQIHRLRELIADWQLLSDLSFADLILWVPLRKDFKSWPTGYVAVAHIRPTTAATLFPLDLIGDEISYGSRPNIDQALSTAEIVRDTQPEPLGEYMVKEETIPVMVDNHVVGVISRHRNSELMRQPSRLELNYREIAHNLYRMVSEGTFPFTDAGTLFDPAPRVGDGIIRLDVNGVVSYASPNARSAFSRLGWISEVEGHNLGEVAKSLARQSPDAQEESISGGLSGKALKRVEIENQGGTISFTVLPLLQSEDRIGAIVLLSNVTELRRRERELITKDATIREVHHRVKNNLQTVSALLRLQSRRVEDPTASAALSEAVRRVASIALVHETLSNQSTESVEFDHIFEQIINNAIDLNPRDIKYTKTGEFGSFDSKIATALSLVITELIHNALEHGLSDSGDLLSVEIVKKDTSYKVTVIDNGAGLPAEFNLEKSANLGLQIANTLTKNELQGSIKLFRENGLTRGEITFNTN